MQTMKDKIKDMFGGLVRFCRKYEGQLTLIHKITKMIVFFTLIYTAFIMYKLGGVLVAAGVGILALFYLILTKMDSIS